MTEIKAQQKAEVIERLKMLRVPKKVREAFETDGRVHLCSRPHGDYRLLTDAEAEKVKAFEQKSGDMVYLVTRAVTLYGVLDSYFFVSKKPSSWDYERDGLDKDYAFVYCENQKNPELSEFGDIRFAHTKSRGIVRSDIDFF